MGYLLSRCAREQGIAREDRGREREIKINQERESERERQRQRERQRERESTRAWVCENERESTREICCAWREGWLQSRYCTPYTYEIHL